MRADSGQIGKFRFDIYGGKRDIMPAYSKNTFGGVLHGGTSDGTRVRNSLRYYGDIKDIGFTAAYDINANHGLTLGLDHIAEDMQRFVKHSNSDMEDRQQFKRTVTRDTYRMTYTGRGGASDWQVDLDYAKMRGDDITLVSNRAHSKYEGKNRLDYIDDILHSQWSIKASANTQINNDHLLTYGFGYSKETGEGSRLKNAPQTYMRAINPWDYDKNLFTQDGSSDKPPLSRVHDYTLNYDENGIPQYDYDYEMYGLRDANGRTLKPIYDYKDYLENVRNDYLRPDAPPDVRARHHAFAEELRNDPNNAWIRPGNLSDDMYLWLYYNRVIDEDDPTHRITYKGRMFGEEYYLRQNKQTVGKAEIKKEYLFVQDTW
ncbi:hypothetical protein [Selenomonas sp. F0473]|uniref:hypothetical protein n=1 Tax=Selenomonas sp. F0473 TaxID=999423 RepID=UPI00029E991A|nr:hypothetical protein HMPREF9161_01644 [Selenomonas sp. F0473]